MFALIFSLLQSFLTIVGSVLIGIILIVLFGEELTTFGFLIILALFISALLFSGMFLDYKLRKKFKLSHKKMFSPLWTALSIFELSLLCVFMIIMSFDLLPVSVLIYDIIIYAGLSLWILASKIKKLSK